MGEVEGGVVGACVGDEAVVRGMRHECGYG